MIIGSHEISSRQQTAMAVLGSLGAILGSFVGIAALGSAIAGTIPMALLGMILGAICF